MVTVSGSYAMRTFAVAANSKEAACEFVNNEICDNVVLKKIFDLATTTDAVKIATDGVTEREGILYQRGYIE